ncbi:MAG: hypothetical protein WCC18_11155 [Candidatus Acidiferrales bacterium]
MSGRDENGTADITLEYQFPSRWVLAEVDMQRRDGATSILGFHVTLMKDSLENINRFTLRGKGIAQYVILALGIGSVVFGFSVFVWCLRSKVGKWKWLWAIFTLVGVGRLGVHWMTGHWTFNLLAICVPCLLANHPPYGPWTVAAYFPIGAVLFLAKRRRTKISYESFPPSDPDLEGKAATS